MFYAPQHARRPDHARHREVIRLTARQSAGGIVTLVGVLVIGTQLVLDPYGTVDVRDAIGGALILAGYAIERRWGVPR